MPPDKNPLPTTPDEHLVIHLITAFVCNPKSFNAKHEKETLDVDAQTFDAAFDEARRRITVAADYNPAKQVRAAVERLNSLYDTAMETNDYKGALQIQKELNKLQQLYKQQEQQPEVEDKTEELERAIAQHLHPLDLADPEMPIVEHARLAALAIISKHSKRKR